MDHTAMHRHTLTGAQMDHVLLLNNACYVDAIKDTWAERAGYHSGTVGQFAEGSSGASLVQIWSCYKMFGL